MGSCLLAFVVASLSSGFMRWFWVSASLKRSKRFELIWQVVWTLWGGKGEKKVYEININEVYNYISILTKS